MDCNKPTKVVYAGELPIYNNIPDYFISELDVEDPETGDVKRTPVRTPGTTVIPNGTLANAICLNPNVDGLEVPKGQVRAGYINNLGSRFVMSYSTASAKPHFLMIGEHPNGIMVQNSGFIYLATPHEYIVGMDYYDSADGSGVPTTDSTSGRHLFTPLSQNVLAVELYNL